MRAIFESLNTTLKSSIAYISPELYIYLENFNIIYNVIFTLKGSSHDIFNQFSKATRNRL